MNLKNDDETFSPLSTPSTSQFSEISTFLIGDYPHLFIYFFKFVWVSLVALFCVKESSFQPTRVYLWRWRW